MFRRDWGTWSRCRGVALASGTDYSLALKSDATNTSGSVLFTDPETNHAQRFYRVRQAP
jgi:hypothetical protein